MTIRELKECFSEFNLKTKITVPDDKVITNQDIEEGKIFQKFVLNENVQRIVDGLEIFDNKIYYSYAAIDSIEIETDEQFPPCGGEQEIAVYAYYSIRMHSTDGEDKEMTAGRSRINALIKLDNDLFTYEKPNLVNKQANNTDVINYVNVNASYYYKGKKYEDTKQVEQTINAVSSWLIESEPTQSIRLSFSENNVSNKGGIVFAKVERTFSRIYYMKDSCGNKVGGKCEPNLTEDITKKAFISSSNKKSFSTNKNVITVSKQEIGAPKRCATITARYLDKSISEELCQNEGGNVNYKRELTFLDGNKISFFDLETSLKTEKKLYIISKKYKYIDEELVNTSNTTNIKIESDESWVNGIKGEDEKGVFISIISTEDNLDKENDREATLVITNIEEPELSIKLIVSQPSLEIVNEEYNCKFFNNGEYTSEEFDKEDFYFIVYKSLIFENGEKYTYKFNESLNVKYNLKTNDKEYLDVTGVVNDDGNYYLKFKDLTSYSLKNIYLTGKSSFYNDNGEKITDSEEVNVTVKANKFVTYSYDFSFEDGSKHKELVWDNSTEPKFLKVDSFKYKMINNKVSDKELSPFKIINLDSNGKEYFNNDFSIKIIDNEIVIFPVKTKTNFNEKYIIVQRETGKKIEFTVEYRTKATLYKMPLNVIVYSNNVKYDIWTGENGKLLIDNNVEIKLKPCWLSPSMKEKTDTAYKGTIELVEGKHRFETFNVGATYSNTKETKCCDIYKEINVDKSTKTITLHINV